MDKIIKGFVINGVLLIGMLFVASSANAAVWKAKNTWDERWENNYRAWVSRYWNDEFFMDEKKPLYYKFEHDCADAVYAMRLVFAYEHRLPFVINNPEKKNKYISNNMKKWDKLPEHRRVRKFMDYIAQVVSTSSLRKDTYPIAMNQIKPGDVYVAPGVHSYTIANITDAGVAEVVYSTTPKAARFMDQIESFPFYVPEDMKGFSDGYRRFIQPQNIKKPLNKQPGYSIEQFTISKAVRQNYVKFTDILSSALGKRRERPEEKSLRLMIALCQYANDRSVYVYDALWHLQKIRKSGRQCMNRREYDSYSTPSRDRRLKAFFNAVGQHHARTRAKAPNSQPKQWAEILFSPKEPTPAQKKQLNDFCMVQMSLGENYYMPLRDLRKSLYAGYVSSDPNAPLEYRWGIVPKKYKSPCKTY
ncbi:MAG: hypothetical protein CSB47_07665 [Proteobacteria bacterium]|nr:MAG: hypothetical protein CSB47_07665 [Pseudomonadota bacterium]